MYFSSIFFRSFSVRYILIERAPTMENRAMASIIMAVK